MRRKLEGERRYTQPLGSARRKHAWSSTAPSSNADSHDAQDVRRGAMQWTAGEKHMTKPGREEKVMLFRERVPTVSNRKPPTPPSTMGSSAQQGLRSHMHP